MIGLRLVQGSREWSLYRKVLGRENYISASEAGTLLNLNKHKVCSSYVMERGERTFLSDAMLHGIKSEPIAIAEVRKILDPRSVYRWLKPDIVVNKPLKISCSPDIMFHEPLSDEQLLEAIKSGSTETTLTGVETKCPFSEPVPMTRQDINPCHVLQCIWGIFACGVKQWYLYYWTEAHGKSLWLIKRPTDEFFLDNFHRDAHDGLRSPLPRTGNRCSREEISMRKELREKWKTQILPVLDISKINFQTP